MRDFLIATLNRTRLTSTRIRAITALAIGCPPNLSKQMYRIGKTIISVTGSMPILKKSNKKTLVRKRWKPGSLGFILRLKCRAREFHRRISRHRDWLAKPGPHLSSELYIIARRGD